MNLRVRRVMIFARELKVMTRFYEEQLGLMVLERGEGFVDFALPGLEWVGTTSCGWRLRSGSPFSWEFMALATPWMLQAIERMDTGADPVSPHQHKPGPPATALAGAR